MELIRFLNDNNVYSVDLKNINKNVISINFIGISQLPSSYTNGFEQLNTNNDEVEGYYHNFTTLYRTYDEYPENIELSNDESVYNPPTPPEPVPEPEPYVPTLEEVKAYKKAEVSTICQNTIFSGFDVELSGGIQHFTLNYDDQLNFIGKQLQISRGDTQIEYHQSKSPTAPCVYYSIDEMSKIIDAATSFKSYHSTYCNSLYMWIDSCTTTDEVNGIYYGIEIPDKYKSEVLEDYITNSLNS